MSEGIRIIAENLKRFRKANNLSQVRLAEIAGIHPRTIQGIEEGGSKTSIQVLFKIAEALHLNLYQFLFTEAEYAEFKARKESRLSFEAAGDFLKKFAELPPNLQKIVLCLVFLDESFLIEIPDDIRRALRPILTIPR